MSRSKTHPAALSAALLGAVLAAGCQTLGYQDDLTPHAEKRLAVDTVSFAQTLRTPAAGALDQAEADRLADFVRRNGGPDHGTVTLVTRSDETRRRTAVLNALARIGVAPARVRFAVDDRGLALDEVRVAVARTAVTLPDCPDFTSEMGSTYDNTPHSNWGCATAANLGLMIADPNDLIAGRGDGTGNGEALALGVQRYRTGQIKPLNIDDSQTGETYGAASPTTSTISLSFGQ
jgi:pilus assembly protein CpaD